jgi:inner membrane protein
MDNLTHSLAGAILGQMGLKKKTGLAMPTLIIAANLPDIDAFATFFGGVQHLALRRGITHGPIAMLVLPILLWAAMLAWERWRPNPKRLPVHKGWLLALAYIGTISHPALDWLNNYGIRLLEPFSSRWFYGDTIFIIDIWIWAALALSLWFSFRRERRGVGDWTRPAWIGFTAICAYIFANGLITGEAEHRGEALVEKTYAIKPNLVVANAVPVKFWERELLWRYQPVSNEGYYFGSGDFSIFRGARLIHHQNTIGGGYTVTIGENDPVRTENRNYVGLIQNDAVKTAAQEAKTNADLRAFLFWSRMPLHRIYNSEDDKYILETSDQRFQNPLARDRFMVSVPLKERPGGN